MEFIPNLVQLMGVLAVVATIVLFWLAGQAVPSRGGLPEASVFCGWIIFSSVLQVLNVVGGIPFNWTLWPLAIAGIFVGGYTLYRRGFNFSRPFASLFILTLPLLFIIAGKAPYGWDSFWFWLPNALYVYQADALPSLVGTEPWSAYPGFPYSLPIIHYVASQFAGGFVSNAVILFDLFLIQLFAVLVLRMVVEAASGPAQRMNAGWGVIAVALTVATFANPSFVAKIVFSSYADTAVSVVVAVAGILAWRILNSISEDDGCLRPLAAQFMLVTALLVNLKQANLILFAVLIAGMMFVAWRDTKIATRPAFLTIMALSLPGIAIWMFWRWHVLSTGGLTENMFLPFSQWQFENIPAILWSMIIEMGRKSGHFILAFAVFLHACRDFGRPRDSFHRATIVAGIMFAGYNFILFFIYFAHFEGAKSTETQSFWRYNTHLGFLFVLLAAYGVTRYARANWPASVERWNNLIRRRALGLSLAGLIAFAPFGFVGSLRTDLDGERPLLRETAQILADKLPSNVTLLLNVPSFYFIPAWEVAHYIRVRRQDLIYLIGRSPKETTGIVRKAGDEPLFLWSICGSTELAESVDLNQRDDESAFFMRNEGQWSIIENWPHPEFRKFRWNQQPTIPMCYGQMPYLSE